MNENDKKKARITEKDQKDIANLKFSDELAKGPIANRRTTDVFFCIFFVLFLAGMIVCAVYGWVKGNPKILFTGWDSD